MTCEEAFAIRYHMGFSDNEDTRNIGKAFELYPMAVLTHMADMLATYMGEKNG